MKTNENENPNDEGRDPNAENAYAAAGEDARLEVTGNGAHPPSPGGYGGRAGVTRPTLADGDEAGRRRRGKIARLPLETREAVNKMLDDGETYFSIVVFLAEQGFRDIKMRSVRSWAKGGYQDWLKEREQLEYYKATSGMALAVVNKDGRSEIADANELIVASAINRALRDFDPVNLKELLADDPGSFLKLAAAIHSQSTELIRREKLELELTMYKDKMRQAREKLTEALRMEEKGGGLTPEALAKIEKAMGIIWRT